jgi:hypothetical protein
MWSCHHGSTWDVIKTHNALLGKWEWKYSRCFWTLADAGCDGASALTIELKNDNSLIVEENGKKSKLPPGKWLQQTKTGMPL